MTGEEIKEQVYDAFACDDMFYRPELRDAIYDMVDENAKLRELATDACTLLRNHYGKDCFDGTIFAERMHELGIEVDDG